MTKDQLNKLGQVVRVAREQKFLSARELAARTGLVHSSIVRLEQGAHTQPKPSVLAAIARELELNLADLYALAGYEQPTELPSFTPYLRSKYGELPAAARAELQQSFDDVARKYGLDANGPQPGEDEF